MIIASGPCGRRTRFMNNHVLQKHSPPARHSLLKNRRRRTEKGYDLTTITFHHPTRPCIANARIVNRDGL